MAEKINGVIGDKIEKLVELSRMNDERGNLSFVEAEEHIPFNIARVYWIYGVTEGYTCQSHAFRSRHEIIIALSGSFDVALHDGYKERKYTLNQSFKALYVPNMIWRRLENFSANSICLVLSSTLYDESDCIRNFTVYKEAIVNLCRTPILYEARPSLQINDLETQYNNINDCFLIEFPIIERRMGNVITVNNLQNIPFSIERLFYIYDIPAGAERGMHAHKRCHQILIAAYGSFKVELDDGENKRTITLNNPEIGLYVPPGVWTCEKEYSSGAVCLVLASEKYSADDYINTYSEYLKYRQHAN